MVHVSVSIQSNRQKGALQSSTRQEILLAEGKEAVPGKIADWLLQSYFPYEMARASYQVDYLTSADQEVSDLPL